jgi:rare lipoprotein A
MTNGRVRTMVRVFLLGVVLLLLTGCGAPEFDPPPAPPPAPVFGESITGIATWYGSLFHGRTTSSGDEFDMEKLTASHASLPFGAIVEVTNPENGKNVRVVINDRHNLEDKFQLSLSKKAAQELDLYPRRTFTVNYMVIE